MTVSTIIQARSASTRLPVKVMKLLLGKPVLWHVVNRVSKARLVEGLTVATTTDAEDDAIEEFCKENGISVFRGSVDDVLDRYYQCAKRDNIKDIVRITADCPLHDPDVIDLVAGEYLKGKCDYASNTIKYTFPDGLDVEIFSFFALESAWKNAKLPSEREHVTPYIRKNAEFKKKNIHASKRYPIYRLTLDYPEDYQFIKKIYEGINKEFFHIDDIVGFLEANPELLKINRHFTMNEGYLKSLEDDKEFNAKEKRRDILIKGDRIFLKELTEEDASQEYCNWINNSEVNRYLDTKKATIGQLKQYIKEKRENTDCLFCGIFTNEANKHIGNVKLEPIDRVGKKTTLGILLGDKNYWGHGIGTEVVKLTIEYALKNLGLEKVDLGVVSENKAAIKCYLKAGFKIEQEEQRAIKYGDKFYDKAIMSIKKSDLIKNTQ